MGVYCNRVDVLLPQLRKNTEVIPGQDGEIDYGNSSYEMRQIKMNCGLIGISHDDFVAKRRKVAAWLSEKGTLIISDEPDKHYKGRIYNAADLIEDDGDTGEFELLWETETHAYGANAIAQAVGSGEVIVPIDYPGSKRSCCTIIVKNIGDAPIRVASLTHVYRRDKNG